MTRPQHSKIAYLLANHQRVHTDKAMLEYVNGMSEKNVEKWDDLSVSEASNIIRGLLELRDKQLGKKDL